MTPAELYAATRAAITDVVRAAPNTRVPVPGTPGWTVHDVVSHVTGIVADVNAGNLDGVATDPWTQRQVDARRDLDTAEVLEEWEREAKAFEPTLDAAPKGYSRTLLIDLVTHEHDVRGALGVPGNRDSEPYQIARKGFAVALAKTLDERGIPGLRLRAPGFEFDAGTDPAATVTAPDEFELFRALSGRRSVAQVLAYDWDGDPAPYLPVMNHFGPLPEQDIIEA